MSGLLEYLAETGLALAAFYALFRLFLKNDTHFHTTRLYLVGSLLAAHLLPLVPVTSPLREVVVPAIGPEEFGAAAAGGTGWTWARALLWLYAAGALLVLVRLGRHLGHLLRMVRRQPASYRAGIRVVYVDEDCPQFSFFRTAFVHRPGGGDERSLDQVVAHERTHIRQGHSLDILLVQLAAVGQWFNPFVWFYKHALKELHEYLADREVLAQGFDPFTYRQLLFEQHLGARSFELAHHLHESQIKRRLTMMTRRSASWTVCKHLLALPALAFLALAFGEPRITMAGSAATIAAPPAAAASLSSGPAQREAGAQSNAAKADKEKTDKAKVVKEKVDEEKVVAKITEKEKSKEAEAAIKEKLKALKAEYEATSDPEKKKAIKEKAAKLQEQMPNGKQVLDLSDPEAVEHAIVQVEKKMELLHEKRQQTVEAADQQKVEQAIEELSKKREYLKARLAEARATHK